MGLRYMGRLIMMRRDALRISDLYGYLMESVTAVGILVGPYTWMMSLIE